jgi:hypothetical protein
LVWWRDHLAEWNGLAIILPPPSLSLQTDASDSGWGAVSDGEETYGFWSLMEKTYGNNARELLAASFGVRAFADARGITNAVVDLETDNTATVAYVNHLGGKTGFLSSIAEDFWDWCLDRRLIVKARHLPGVQNVVADRLSRIANDRSDWKLNPALFGLIDERWGPHDVDLFATPLNRQVEKFISWKPQPGAFLIDAFAHRWNSLRGWANPPFIKIGAVLQKVRREQSTITMVAPLWLTQPWFPVLCELACELPLLLPRSEELFLSGTQGNELPTGLPQWESAVWRVSGDHRLVTRFRRECESSPTVPGALPLDAIIKRGGVRSVTGAPRAALKVPMFLPLSLQSS